MDLTQRRGDAEVPFHGCLAALRLRVKAWSRLAQAATALLLILLAACAPARTGDLPPTQAPPFIGEPQIPESEVPRVSLEEAKAALDAKTAVFLDVRAAGSYAASHVPGALSIPLNELEGRLGELDPEQWIIAYCT